MLCAAESDPFQGDNYRIAAVIHESILCPILNKLTVLIFSTPKSIQYSSATMRSMQPTKKIFHQQQQYSKLTATTSLHQKQPAIGKTSYYSDNRTTTQLKHRKSNSADYQLRHHSPQHLLLQQQQNQHDEHKEAVFKDDYILEPDDIDMEVIDPSTTSAAADTAITAEYTMPTTKID